MSLLGHTARQVRPILEVLMNKIVPDDQYTQASLPSDDTEVPDM